MSKRPLTASAAVIWCPYYPWIRAGAALDGRGPPPCDSRPRTAGPYLVRDGILQERRDAPRLMTAEV